MNDVLELKGKRFVQASKNNPSGGMSMNSKVTVTCDYISHLINELIKIQSFWNTNKRPFKGILITVYYNKIVAKSNRISGIFKGLQKWG